MGHHKIEKADHDISELLQTNRKTRDYKIRAK